MIGAFFMLGEIRAFFMSVFWKEAGSMGSRIKGITIEIGGDTTGLEKALKNVNSTIRSTQYSLKDLCGRRNFRYQYEEEGRVQPHDR